jgi:hypothetical protein
MDSDTLFSLENAIRVTEGALGVGEVLDAVRVVRPVRTPQRDGDVLARGELAPGSTPTSPR